MSKKKMRPGKFSAIVAPFSVLGIAVAIAIPVLSNGGYETTLNTYSVSVHFTLLMQRVQILGTPIMSTRSMTQQLLLV